MGWKVSMILSLVGVFAAAISTQLIQIPEARLYGIAAGAISAGCLAAAAYLQEQGYKLAKEAKYK